MNETSTKKVGILHDADLKALVFDIVAFADGYNANGQRTSHTNIPKQMLSTRQSIITKLRDFTEICMVKKDVDVTKEIASNDLNWLPFNELWNSEKRCSKEAVKDMRLINERFLDGDLGLTKDEMSCLKYFLTHRTSFDEAKVSNLSKVGSLLTDFIMKGNSDGADKIES